MATPVATSQHPSERPLPRRPIERLTAPLKHFLHIEAASGALLLFMAAVALVMANTGMADGYRDFVETRVVLGAGTFALDYPLWYWVNDGLMTLFFFVVGLEIKREMTTGELTDAKKAALPVIAAIGGAALPALIFLAVLGDAAGGRAWAVPMATDIAFVVGALAIFGKRVPNGLKIFVLTLAIVDDLMAVCIIAIFYSAGIATGWLAGAAAGFVVILAMRQVQVRSVAAYVLVGVFIWLCTLKSGVHPTIAGVILGMLTPAAALLGRKRAAELVDSCASRLKGDDDAVHGALDDVAVVSREARSPLERLEHGLHPWVAFLILPIFVFVNAGVAFGDADVTSGVGLAIALGLLVGKPVGIGIFSYVSVKLGWAKACTGVTWPQMIAAGVLCGVGFTMSLFIASLGLEGAQLENAKAGILYGSGASLALGLVLLAITLKKPDEEPTADAAATPAPAESAP